MEFIGTNTKGVQEQMIVPLSDETSDLEVLEGAYTFHFPYGFTIEKVYLSLNEATADGDVTVDINFNNTSIFSTVATIDAQELTSSTAAVQSAFIANSNKITAFKPLVFDIDVVGNAGATGTGLKVMLIGHRTTTLS